MDFLISNYSIILTFDLYCVGTYVCTFRHKQFTISSDAIASFTCVYAHGCVGILLYVRDKIYFVEAVKIQLCIRQNFVG